MSSLATKEVLEKELVEFTERFKFLDDWISSLASQDDFDTKDKIYKLSKERDFKKNLASQRGKQIEQIEKQDALKKKASEEFPNVLKKAEETINTMTSDIDVMKKTQVIGKAKKEEKNVLISGITQQRDHMKEVFKAIQEKYNEDHEHKELLADFRTLHEVIKIGERK